MGGHSGPGSNRLRIGRVSIRQQPYLLTAVCHGRRCVFARTDIAQAACRVLNDASSWPSAKDLVWVLMPDHWHGLVVPTADESLAQMVRRIKSLVTQALHRQGLWAGRVWQPSFHDHALRVEESVIDSARYVLDNPVRAKLVERWQDWPHKGGEWVGQMLGEQPAQ